MKKALPRAPLLFLAAGIVFVFLVSCSGLTVKIGTNAEDPLKQRTIEGSGRARVLVVPIAGFLSESSEEGLLSTRPSVVQEVVSQLRLAEKDSRVRALVLEIDSPGGSTTAADILYHEIAGFKERTHLPVVAAFMRVAASGGYYVALPADRVVAHPTTVTGSIGVILLQPRVSDLMGKIGVAVDVTKSGRDKDMGSPFRLSTPEEQKLFQGLIDRLAGRFFDLVKKHRRVKATDLDEIFSARVFLADDAVRLGLVDRVGYLSDALSEAKTLSGLPDDAKVVVYRRTKYPNDNLYNTSARSDEGAGVSLVDLRLRELVPTLSPGFYYLWMPGLSGK